MLDELSNTQLGAVAVFTITAVPLLRLFYTSLLPNPISGVPHNPITSIWGDVPQIKKARKEKSFSEHLADEISKHGPIFQILVGRRKVVVLSDYAEVERILVHSKNVEQSDKIHQTFGTVVPMGQIALPTNETWKRHRRVTGPSMSNRYLERMSARIITGASNLARLWSAKLDLVGAAAFDADLDLQLATMDIIVNIMTGTSAGSIDAAYNSLPSILSSSAAIAHIPPSPIPPLHASIREMMASIERVSVAVFSPLAARLEWISPAWRKHYAYLSTFFNDKITEARAKEERDAGLATDADSVVDMVVQREEQEGMGKMGRQELVDELMTYVMQDTTASALAWHVKYLPQDPAIQRELHDEVCAVFGQDGELNFEAIEDSGRVPMLEAVVAETLRCAQVGTMIGRKLLAEEVILGRVIPKGTPFVIPIGIMNNKESTWGSDASQWKPKRWLNPDGSFNRATGPSVPFGLGQRSCFGKKLATLQLKIFVATLSRAFYFREVPEAVGSFDPVELVTRQPKMCHVSLKKWD
ncbi:cytochrome P450 [Ceratobasidium sp. AG-I]|nr:cytochrome P450 [Ceratobasidium sp. AG-I]